ncbi:hypothetical protein J416_03226 [Gracilibacillus halophilus YIM-C55.5]|uniref:Uncharacterized protein n=1 Tax=Gracilibacillus halophilus YIM-C55.5 TaxID=1308866 RepID=N4WC30_9BACI|nr:glycoside hydrolase N-terminal domain-containing protein [Gracilibacillus halophilus]ENH97843.1 hypothetical protein J416_03226 [Gracilibacillus halophilus YIM-C55.5]
MHEKPDRGVWTEKLADRWEDGLVSGNGSQGVIVYGHPVHDTLIGNHCRCYLPQGNQFDPPHMAPYLSETRQLIQTDGYDKALAFYYQRARAQGYQGLTMSDPFHPAYSLSIQTDHYDYTDYFRSINYQTGELIVSYRFNGIDYKRRTFVSRSDHLMIHQLSPGSYRLQMQDEQQHQMKQHFSVGGDHLHINTSYLHSEGGYDVLMQINSEELTPLTDKKGYIASSQTPILIAIKIQPYSSSDKRPLLKQLGMEKQNYKQLFERHQSIHQEMFDRVRLDLADSDDRAQDIWKIVEQAQKQDSLPSVLIEKMYDAGRYMYICSAGELTPNLQGIWTGTFHPAWSGDFTFDTNVQLSIASALSGRMAEGLHGFFRLVKELLPGFRENARKYYGCRGILSTAHSSNDGRHVHWNPDWPLHFWTCGAGWLAHWFYQYYRYTKDQLFLREEVIPLLKEIVLFYEDFLIEDTDGVYRFTPSYSAENGCGDNATQDIAVAKEVLMNLIEAHQILGIETKAIEKWRKMINKMPRYQVNQEGVLKEWLTPDKEENDNHRHFSHLYPIFQSREWNPQTDVALWQAARKAFDKRLEAWLRNEDSDNTSTHGRMHAALCATQFHMPALIDEIFKQLVDGKCFFSSLMMSHYEQQEIFNVDGNGAFPQVIHEMLVDYKDQRLVLLGALPDSIPHGEIRGMQLADQITVDYMSWNLERRQLMITLSSEHNRTLHSDLPLFPQAKPIDHSSNTIDTDNIHLTKEATTTINYHLS